MSRFGFFLSGVCVGILIRFAIEYRSDPVEDEEAQVRIIGMPTILPKFVKDQWDYDA